MIKVEKEFAYGYARPVNRGVILWNGDKENREETRYGIDNLIYEALGEENFWSSAHQLEGIKVTIEISRATKE